MPTVGRWAGILVVGLACSCGSSSSDSSSSGLAFHGEGKLLDGFSFDTGPQPPTGPASVSLRLSGTGLVTVDASATVDGGALVGTAGSGKLAIDAHVKLDGTLKIDSPVKKSSGDIPGLADVDIAIVGNAAFDPFLLDGGSAVVTADVPETKLPDIPLGSVPGKLQLTVEAGSTLTSTFSGTCMTIASGQAQYAGSAVTSGTLKIKGTIVLELPAPLNKSIDLPEITVPIPSATSAVTFAPVDTGGADDSVTGSCGASGDAGDDAASMDSTSMDSSVEDSASIDSGFDSTFDSDVDSGPISCSGEEAEPNDTVSSAKSLGTIDDCDGSGKTVTGVLHDEKDVDVYTFEGKDTFGCSVNAYAKATGAFLCLRPACKSGTTQLKGCTKGSQLDDQCCGVEAESDFNCSGTSDESATVTIRVYTPTGTIACGNYSLSYHY